MNGANPDDHYVNLVDDENLWVGRNKWVNIHVVVRGSGVVHNHVLS